MKNVCVKSQLMRLGFNRGYPVFHQLILLKLHDVEGAIDDRQASPVVVE